jgi:hypothetical protein
MWMLTLTLLERGNSLLKNGQHALMNTLAAGSTLVLLLLFPLGNATAETISVRHQDTTVDVDASLTNGTVESIVVDEDFTSIILAVETAGDEDGILSITLPRTLIDSRQGNSTSASDNKFIVVVGNIEVDYEEIRVTESERELKISVPAGTGHIEIVGTQVVPEFSFPFVMLLAAFGSVSLIAFAVRHRGVIRPD